MRYFYITLCKLDHLNSSLVKYTFVYVVLRIITDVLDTLFLVRIFLNKSFPDFQFQQILYENFQIGISRE